MKLRRGHSLIAAVCAMLAPFAIASGCVERDRLCASTTECGATNACIAGRCQPTLKDDAGRILPPVISSPQVHRVVVSPTDIAYISAHTENAPADLPPVLVLGRAGDAAELLLRFSVTIAEEESVVEAYLLMDRSDVIESDPKAITLHAARIIDAWDGRLISYERQPRWEDTGSPATIVSGAGRPLVRIDVRDLVTHWKERDPRDQGLIVIADETSRTGIAFAATASIIDQGPTSMLGAAPEDTHAVWASAPPRLELYLRRNPHDSHLNLPAASSSNLDGGPMSDAAPSASGFAHIAPSAIPSSTFSRPPNPPFRRRP